MGQILDELRRIAQEDRTNFTDEQQRFFRLGVASFLKDDPDFQALTPEEQNTEATALTFPGQQGLTLGQQLVTGIAGQAAEFGLGTAETAGKLATIPAELAVRGLTGLGELARTGGDIQAAARQIEQAPIGIPIQTETGRGAMGLVGLPFELLGEAGQFAGRKTEEVIVPLFGETVGIVAGQTVAGTIAASPMLFGLLRGRRGGVTKADVLRDLEKLEKIEVRDGKIAAVQAANEAWARRLNPPKLITGPEGSVVRPPAEPKGSSAYSTRASTPDNRPNSGTGTTSSSQRSASTCSPRDTTEDSGTRGRGVGHQTSL